MQLRTAKDLGAFIRDQRKKQRLNQSELANKVGVSRRWILEVEHGKQRAEIGLVLKTLDALGLTLSVDNEFTAPPRSGDEIKPVDIDAVVENAKRSKS